MTVFKVSFSKSEFIDGKLNESDDSDVLNVIAETADEAIEKAKIHVNGIVNESPELDDDGNETGKIDKFEYTYNCTNEVTYICEIDVE